MSSSASRLRCSGCTFVVLLLCVFPTLAQAQQPGFTPSSVTARQSDHNYFVAGFFRWISKMSGPGPFFSLGLEIGKETTHTIPPLRMYGVVSYSHASEVADVDSLSIAFMFGTDGRRLEANGGGSFHVFWSDAFETVRRFSIPLELGVRITPNFSMGGSVQFFIGLDEDSDFKPQFSVTGAVEPVGGLYARFRFR